MTYDLIIAGAGAAGLFAAANIQNGINTLLVEKNDIIGRKLLAAGGGKCNITHKGSIEEFYDKYGKNGKFLRKAFNNYDNSDVISFFEKNNVECFSDKNGKIFPKSEKAKDVIEAMFLSALSKGVKLMTNSSIIEIIKEKDIFVVRLKNETLYTKNLLLTTGGSSYPTLGTSGDGYKLSSKLGHKIVELKPALTPVFIENFKLSECAGLSFTNVKILQLEKGSERKLGEYYGDIGITHNGISGPGIIDYSRYFNAGNILSVNLSGEKSEDVEKKLLDYICKNGKNVIKGFFKEYEFSEKLIIKLFDEIKSSSLKKCCELSKNERKEIVKFCCDLRFEIKELGGYNVAMVTSGGIDLKEVSPSTMESKIVSSLYFAGEILDIDGNSGGYNIQAAFSTGKLAVDTICEKIKKTI